MDNSVPATSKSSKVKFCFIICNRNNCVIQILLNLNFDYDFLTFQDGTSLEKATFDRLKPRHSNSELKRKSSSSANKADEDSSDAKVRKTEFKKEYSKLRKLVPALDSRNDITKVLNIHVNTVP